MSKRLMLCRELATAGVLAMLVTAATDCVGAVPKCEGTSPALEAQEARDRNFPTPNLSGAAAALYDATRKKIDTRTRYHSAVFAFDSYATPFTFYLVGFEKPRAHSERPYCAPGEAGCTTPAFEASRFNGRPGDAEAAIRRTRDDIKERLFGDPRSMVLTHAMRARKNPSEAGDQRRDGCFAYNVYADKTSVPWCQDRHLARPDTSTWTRQGWEGLDRLADDLERGGYSRKADAHRVARNRLEHRRVRVLS